MARAAASVIESRPFVLEDSARPTATAGTCRWQTDPFLISADLKKSRSCSRSTRPRSRPARITRPRRSALCAMRNFLASSRGSAIEQIARARAAGHGGDRDRPGHGQVRVLLASLAAPRGSRLRLRAVLRLRRRGGKATRRTRAKNWRPSRSCRDDYDLVLDPTNLWLTIHESVGHPTELDRALGWEANFAGTTFCTPDQLGKLRYGSELMTVVADRSQEGGPFHRRLRRRRRPLVLDAEFPDHREGHLQVNYQMAIGQAQLIGQAEVQRLLVSRRTGRAFPIQRMPNVSLQPNPQPCKLDDLIG